MRNPSRRAVAPRAGARATLAIGCGLAVATPAAAHPLDEGTARITLRDAHVEVVADWDLFLLLDPGPTAIAVATPAELAAAHAALRRRIEERTRLRVDGASVPLTVTAGPSPDELRAMAATLSASGRPHGERARLRLESPRSFPNARRVSLSGPRELGSLVVSFAQPASRYTHPGDSANFDVLAPVAAPVTLATPVERAPSSGGRMWTIGAVALVGVVLVAARSTHWIGRKS